MPLAIPAIAPEKEFTPALESLVDHTAILGYGERWANVVVVVPSDCEDMAELPGFCMARAGTIGGNVSEQSYSESEVWRSM